MCSMSEAHLQRRARMCSTNQAHYQYEQGGGGTTQKYFPINESLLLLIYQVKTVAYGRLQKSIDYEILKEIFSF